MNLPPFINGEKGGEYSGALEALRANFDYLRRSRQELVVFTNGNAVYSTSYEPMLRQHEETGADVFVITPVEPYTDEDLNWTNDNSRVVYEHDHPEAQNEVALTEITPENWDNYDTVYIGYPIWWGIAAWPVNQFVTGNDFTGKAVIPFCTSASSGLGQSSTLLAEEAGTGEWLEGARFSYGTEEADVQAWISGLTESIAQAIEQAQTVTKD